MTRNAEMVFLMGTPGAGKTTLGTERFGSTHVFICADDFKAAHPDYAPKDAAWLTSVHQWSLDEAERMFHGACAVGQGRWVMDGTGAHAESIVRRIKEARAAGFYIRLFYVQCSLETSLKRNARRERTLPEDVVRAKAADISVSFEIVSAYADEVETVDNDRERV